MTCEQCQELISAFLDNDLAMEVSLNIQTHLGLCAECAKVCEDFASILDFCNEVPTEESVPPNPKALWCRINNIIETEVQAEIIKEKVEPEKKKGFWKDTWRFSLPQVASMVLCIALVSYLLTFVGIKNYTTPTDDVYSAKTFAELGFVDKALAKIGLIETPQQVRERRIKERIAAIDYWNNRVQTRRSQWENHLRDAFDRNIREIDQAVFEYTEILEKNPQDDLSSEMLDSALNEKMELLREFSEM
jgi:hypothetical protein